MKATGIVRRIDDLGRVVIPKEIRRTMRIREGDPMEIYTDQCGGVVFKKYSPIAEVSDFAQKYADVLCSSTKKGVIICDRDCCVAVAGIPKKEIIERRISQALEEIMQERKTKSFTIDTPHPAVLEGTEHKIAIASPIICEGDISGAVVFVAEDGFSPDDDDCKLATVAAQILAKQLETA